MRHMLYKLNLNQVRQSTHFEKTVKTEILPGEVVISVADAEMEKHSET